MAASAMQSKQIASNQFHNLGLELPRKMPDGSSVVLPLGIDSMVSTGSFASSIVLSTPNSPASVFTSQQTIIEFIIAGRTLSQPLASYSQVYLETHITNSDLVNPLILAPGFQTMMFESITVLIDGSMVETFNGGSNVIGHGIRHKILSNMTQTEYDQNPEVYGYLDGSSTVTIPANSTSIFEFPIHCLYPHFCSLPLSSVRSELKLRFTYGSASQIITSASLSTSISASQIRMICLGQIIPQSSDEMVRNIMDQSTVRIPASTIVARTFQIGPTLPNVETPRSVINVPGFLLESLYGLVANTVSTPTDFINLLSALQSSKFYNSAAISVYQGLDSPAIESVIEARLYSGPSFTGYAMDRATYLPDLLDYKSACVHSTGLILSDTQRHGSFLMSTSESFSLIPQNATPNATQFVILLIASSLTLTRGVLSYQISGSAA